MPFPSPELRLFACPVSMLPLRLDTRESFFFLGGYACLCSLFNGSFFVVYLVLSGPFSFLGLKKSRPGYSEASQHEHSQIQVFFLLSLVAHEFGSVLCNYACLLCMCTNTSKNIILIMKGFCFSSSPNLPTQALLIDYSETIKAFVDIYLHLYIFSDFHVIFSFRFCYLVSDFYLIFSFG